jgi:transcriptional regulator with XRE-family HTH domain
MRRKEKVTIGSELKKFLDKEKMTAYRLSQEVGLTQGYLSRLFKDRFNPSYGLVKKIAEVLGYEIRFVKCKKKGGGSFR